MTEPANPALTRPERVLRLIAVYGLITRALVRWLICGGSERKTENVFYRLLKQRRIHAYPVSASLRTKYYVLSRTEAIRLGARVLTGRRSARAIEHASAVVHYCHQPPATRRRLKGGLLQKRLPFSLPTLSPCYVVERQPQQYFGRVIVPGRNARVDYALHIVRREGTFLERQREAIPWLRDGSFRFVILTLSDARRRQFEEAFAQERGRQRLRDDIRVDVVQVKDIVDQKEAQS